MLEYTDEFSRKIICTVCEEIARREQLADAYVSVSLVDEEQIRSLNRDYRDKDAVTDVLSFALLEGDEPEILAIDGVDEPQCLGDIVICFPQLLAQAASYGHSVERELAFLTAHGMLHLIGYDHEDVIEEQKMFGQQEEVLKSLGILR